MNSIRRLCACRNGAVAVMTAIVLPVLLGFVGLGTEVGHWYLKQRVMQGSADAAALSAAAQWVVDANAGNPASTTYRTVGVSYASINGGFTIPTSNVCLYTSSGLSAGCNVLTLDSRTIVCANPPCIVVEITQNTAAWLSTKASMEPGPSVVQSIPAPVLKARAIVSVAQSTQTVTSGNDCILALANDPQAVLVHGNGDLVAKCGVSIDGGIDQNVSGTPLGGITYNGSHAKVEVNSLTISANYTYATDCPAGHCYLYNSADPTGGSTTVLPTTDYTSNKATADPYAASLNFPTGPLGVQTGGIQVVSVGTGYGPNGLCTFAVDGGTGTPAKFTATIANGKINTAQPITVIDPGAYTAFPPTSSDTATSTTCGGSQKATFNLTEGCFTWNGAAIPGRKYCSINANNVAINFPAGNYYIAGGDTNCVGFCAQGGGSNITSDSTGVTFYLEKGDGANSRGSTYYATVSISGMGSSGSLALCSPGSNSTSVIAGVTHTCGTGNDTNGNPSCTGSCMLFVEDPAATGVNGVSSASSTGPNTVNAFSGNANTILSGLVYLPKQTFQTTGNTSIGGCFGVIAKYVDVGGTPSFANGCLPGDGFGNTITETVYSNPILYQ